MKILIWACMIVGIGFFFGSIWLFCYNRSSETIWSKVMPAFVIGSIGIFFTIWFSTKSESIDTRFNYTLYFNKTDKRPLDHHCNDQYAYGGAQFYSDPPNFISNKIAEMELDKLDFNKDGDKVKDFYFDLAFVKLISSFFAIYSGSWDIYLDSTRRGNSLTRIR